MSPHAPAPPIDPFDLARFEQAQQAVYAQALAELRAGRKRTHWMWFVLPQLRGLGASEMSRRYAIASLAEARAYLMHPVLGARLRECVAAICAHAGRGAAAVLGEVDAQKFRSCLTLFAEAAADEPLFRDALGQCCGGAPDSATLALLAAGRPPR